MKSTGLVVTLVLCLLCKPVGAGPKTKVVVINGPTVIAFFPPVTDKDLSQDPDTNESLSDFQVYAQRVREKLHDAGINFQEVYASSFAVKCQAATTRFRPQKEQVGYYFVAPGKSARVEYGVMTDDDILLVAKEYFRSTPKR